MPALTTTRLTTRAEAAHLLNRAGFGPAPGDIDRLLQGGLESFLHRQLAPEPETDAVVAKLRNLPSIDYTASEFVLRHQRDGQSRASVECPLDELRSAKLIRAAESPNQLREVMADFWYNHFNVYIYAWEPSVPEYERETIRPRVFGGFRDLLGAVAQSPAMTYYLDTFVSTADRMVGGKVVRGLNENYGRELLELHTVGVNAGYTQHDVTEAARCFTGWDFGGWYAPIYGHRFASENHDDGAKHVFGLGLPAEGGERDGHHLLDYLAVHPATARFVSWRLVQRFVADDPPESLVTRCAAVFTESDGSIAEVLRTILSSDEFWSQATFRSKVKTPLEFAVSAIRSTGGAITDGKAIGQALGDMGMPLYECRPPTGYSNRSTDWISVSAQLYRFNFALALAGGTLRGAHTAPLPTTEPVAAARAFGCDVLGAEVSEGTAQAVTRVTPGQSVQPSVKATALLLASPDFQMR